MDAVSTERSAKNRLSCAAESIQPTDWRVRGGEGGEEMESNL